MLRQSFMECGGVAAAFEAVAPLLYSRGASRILCRRALCRAIRLNFVLVSPFSISQNFLGHLHLICP